MEIKTMEELQTAVKTQTQENQNKELIKNAIELGIDLKEYGMNEDGTPLEVKKEIKKEEEVKVEKSAEELKEEQEETRKVLLAETVAALKEAFSANEEEKTKVKSKIYG